MNDHTADYWSEIAAAEGDDRWAFEAQLEVEIIEQDADAAIDDRLGSWVVGGCDIDRAWAVAFNPCPF